MPASSIFMWQLACHGAISPHIEAGPTMGGSHYQLPGNITQNGECFIIFLRALSFFQSFFFSVPRGLCSADDEQMNILLVVTPQVKEFTVFSFPRRTWPPTTTLQHWIVNSRPRRKWKWETVRTFGDFTCGSQGWVEFVTRIRGVEKNGHKMGQWTKCKNTTSSPWSWRDVFFRLLVVILKEFNSPLSFS